MMGITWEVIAVLAGVVLGMLATPACAVSPSANPTSPAPATTTPVTPPATTTPKPVASPAVADQANEFDGTIVSIDSSRLTVVRADKQQVVVPLTNTTWVQRVDGSRGTAADLKTGATVEVYLLPSTGDAFKVELRGSDTPSPTKLNMTSAAGVITMFSSPYLVIKTDSGTEVMAEVVGATRIEKLDGSNATMAELKAGVRIEVYFATSSRNASRVEIKSQ